MKTRALGTPEGPARKCEEVRGGGCVEPREEGRLECWAQPGPGPGSAFGGVLRWDSPAGLSGLRQGRTGSALLEVHWVGLVCPGSSSVSLTFQYNLFSVER